MLRGASAVDGRVAEGGLLSVWQEGGEGWCTRRIREQTVASVRENDCHADGYSSNDGHSAWRQGLEGAPEWFAAVSKASGRTLASQGVASKVALPGVHR